MLAQVIIWIVVFERIDTVAGYTRNEMISYVVIGWMFLFITTTYTFENIIFNKQTYEVAGEPTTQNKFNLTVANSNEVAVAQFEFAYDDDPECLDVHLLNAVAL